MVTHEIINISTDLKRELEDIARSNNTNIDNVIKILLIENKELKNPSHLTTTKISKNKSTYSSVIPAPIKNKFNLNKGQVLYWDIEDNKIIITPEAKRQDLPETPSLKAGYEILNDLLINNNIEYGNEGRQILEILNNDQLKDNPEETLKELKQQYGYTEANPMKREAFKKVVLYLLDYHLEPNQNGVLKELYKEITQDGN